MIGLADCNNFFVSCERSVNPALEGKAVVVLSNNDGCVVARSNESKRMGVRMGQPAFEIRHLVESGQLIALSGNHLLYRDISLRVHDIFRRYVPATIDYSVDEAFLHVDGIPVDVLEGIGNEIYRSCWEEMHIPVTVGFAPTKTLAKVSTELCKKSGRKVGVMIEKAEIDAALASLPVSELWGVGRRLAKRLYQSGVYTIADFARAGRAWVRKTFGVTGERSWFEVNGQPCIELSHIGRTLQDSISESRTFPDDVLDYDYIRARIVIYASDCAGKLRAMKGLCGAVGVFLRSNPFHPERGVYRPEGCLALPFPTSDTSLIVEAALAVLDGIFIPGVPFKRAGVWMTDILADVPATPSLFEATVGDTPVVRRFMKTIDRINNEVGHSHIALASQIVKGHQGHNDGYSSSFQAPRRENKEIPKKRR